MPASIKWTPLQPVRDALNIEATQIYADCLHSNIDDHPIGACPETPRASTLSPEMSDRFRRSSHARSRRDRGKIDLFTVRQPSSKRSPPRRYPRAPSGLPGWRRRRRQRPRCASPRRKPAIRRRRRSPQIFAKASIFIVHPFLLGDEPGRRLVSGNVIVQSSLRHGTWVNDGAPLGSRGSRKKTP